jgi:hypothetical protein
MSRIAEHRFTFPVVRPAETAAPVKTRRTIASTVLVEARRRSSPRADDDRSEPFLIAAR